jgi:hypothetical protein
VLLKSNEEVKECIVKFDEDISIKANYSQLDTLRAEIANSFIPNNELHKLKQQGEDNKKDILNYNDIQLRQKIEEL